jgi:radical SAM protein with 4Fe4S-binding SPASM domain
MALPFGRLDKRTDLVLDQAGYLKLAGYIARQRKAYGDLIWAADCMGYYTDLEKYMRKDYRWYGCHAGINIFGLLSDGSVTGCLSLQDKRFVEGNIRRRKLKDIWFDTTLFSYNRNFKKTNLQGGCKDCSYGPRCRAGCRNSAFSSTGLLFDNIYCIFRIKRGRQNGQEKSNQ